jgi:hypothetical protein
MLNLDSLNDNESVELISNSARCENLASREKRERRQPILIMTIGRSGIDRD